MAIRTKGLLLGLTAAVMAHASYAAKDSNIRVALEEPVNAGIYAGISNLRGWAAAPNGIEVVEVFIDGSYAFDVPMGGLRGDVGNRYPTYPGSDFAGYSMAYNYKSLSPGRHDITVRAIDGLGNYNERSGYFFAERFNSGFIADSNDVDLSTATGLYQVDQHSLEMSGVSIEGDQWDVTLSWDGPSQGFQIVGITPASGQGAPHGGVYACLTSPVDYYFSDDVNVTMKNGMVLNNYNGLTWDDDEQHTVFKTTSGRWYTIEEDQSFGSEMYRLDVTAEPSSCFEADYLTVTDRRVNSSGQRVLVFGNEGEITVRSGCEIDKNSPVTYFEPSPFGDEVTLVDLKTAESCSVLAVTTY